jgi:DNA polymerase elongation subunit (family B)
MLENVKVEDIIFLDIETVPAVADCSMLDPAMQLLWDKKSKQFRTEDQSSEDVFQRAGIYAEFGKIICISVGVIKEKNPGGLRLKSFYGDDEKVILSEFSAMVSKFSKNKCEIQLCGHNGKEFDFPFIARRMIIHGIAIPPVLDNAGKKPWEIKLLDTMDLWKFGDYKNYTSLDLLTSILGIPTPKGDIEGSMVAGVYWNDKDLARIVHYCERDVVAVVQVLFRFMNLPPIAEERIESVTFFQA